MKRRSLDPRWSLPCALLALVGAIGIAGAASRTTTPAAPAGTSASARAAMPAGKAKVARASAKSATARATRKGATARKRTIPKSATAGTPMPAATGGMIVAIDPETARPGPPSPAQIRALMGPGTETSRTDEGLVEIHHPSGATGILLDERYQEYTLVRVGPGGKKYYGCVQGDGHLHEFKGGVIPTPPVLEEE